MLDVRTERVELFFSGEFTSTSELGLVDCGADLECGTADDYAKSVENLGGNTSLTVQSALVHGREYQLVVPAGAVEAQASSAAAAVSFSAGCVQP